MGGTHVTIILRFRSLADAAFKAALLFTSSTALSLSLPAVLQRDSLPALALVRNWIRWHNGPGRIQLLIDLCKFWTIQAGDPGTLVHSFRHNPAVLCYLNSCELFAAISEPNLLCKLGVCFSWGFPD